jgi:hypothetical protein
MKQQRYKKCPSFGSFDAIKLAGEGSGLNMDQVRTLFTSVLDYLEEGVKDSYDITTIQLCPLPQDTLNLVLMGRYLATENKSYQWRSGGSERTWVRPQVYRFPNTIKFRWLDRRIGLKDEERLIYGIEREGTWRVPADCVQELVAEFCGLVLRLVITPEYTSGYDAFHRLIHSFPVHNVVLDWTRPKLVSRTVNASKAIKDRMTLVRTNQRGAEWALHYMFNATTDRRREFVEEDKTTFFHAQILARKFGCVSEVDAIQAAGTEEYNKTMKTIEQELQKLHDRYVELSEELRNLLNEHIEQPKE